MTSEDSDETDSKREKPEFKSQEALGHSVEQMNTVEKKDESEED